MNPDYFVVNGASSRIWRVVHRRDIDDLRPCTRMGPFYADEADRVCYKYNNLATQDDQPGAEIDAASVIREAFERLGCHVASLTRSGNRIAVELPDGNLIEISVTDRETPTEHSDRMHREAFDRANAFRDPEDSDD